MKTTFNFADANKTLWSGAAVAAVLMIAGGAPATSHALVLTAANAICTSDSNGGNDTVFLTACGVTNLDLLYKANRGGSEEGSFAGDYSTAFAPPTTALITWDGFGADIINCPTCFLVAKDGNSTPNWFLFNLGSWDGEEEISIGTLFYKTNPNGNQIVQDFSHVSIWSGVGGGGGGEVEIPEPGVLFLMGAGLLGLGLARRRKSA
jgi:hypothetical protein